MTLSAEVKKLAESKPFYAVAGAGDFAVEKLRELPEQIQRLQGRREEIREVARDLPEKAKGIAGKAEGYAKDLPDRAKEFAGRAEGYAKDFPEKARVYADQFTVRATELYEEFASRGRKVVSKASGEAALELEELSEAAEPAVATQATRKNTRTPRSGPTTKA